MERLILELIITVVSQYDYISLFLLLMVVAVSGGVEGVMNNVEHHWYKFK